MYVQPFEMKRIDFIFNFQRYECELVSGRIILCQMEYSGVKVKKEGKVTDVECRATSAALNEGNNSNKWIS